MVMVVVLIVAGAGLAALAAVLLTVYRLRPASFRLTASMTKWFSMTLEMRAPERGANRDQTQRRNVTNGQSGMNSRRSV